MNLPLRQYVSLLREYLAAQRARVLLLALLLFGGIALQLLNPQILRAFIDSAQGGGPLAGLVTAALAFIGVALLQQALAVGATYVGELVGWTATNALRADLLQHALSLDMGFHNARTPGELIERIDGDVTAMANFFAQFVLRVLGNAVLLVGILVLFAREDWRVGLVMGGFVLVALAVLVRLRNIAAPSWAAGRAASAAFMGFVEERLGGLEDIRASGAAPQQMRQLYGHMRELVARYRRARMVEHGALVATRGTFALGQAAALAVGAYLFFEGALSVGTVYMIAYYAGLLVSPLEQLTTQLQDLQRAGAGIERAAELRGFRPAVGDGASAAPPAALAVELDGVSFAYAEGHPVLDGVSLRLAPGAVLGLLGRTGSGKTTITRLLARLYDPGAGAVRLGGVDVRELRLAELRRRVGVVTQDVQLFRASVRDNLTFFDRSVPDERIVAALEEMGMGAWLRALPRGLDTPLASGEALSAGEAQLLAFTRVLLKEPGLVILDEASSRLDPATERRLERAVGRLLAGRTGIIIAHKLATVQRVDAIAILEAGRVVEHGPRAALAADPSSLFAGLLRAGLEEVLT
ncbi:MAG TPA: ABC transporter ATP-binding protein [Chloroflexaceae bacterium]|mgnify:CR=1 FL=1|nr:ABC transporter ATP-binding protein [Chloroflexaceae bacterium]